MPDVNANATLRKTNVLRETNVKLKANWHLRFTWQLLQEKDLFSAMLWGKYLELLGQCFQRTRGQPQFLQVCWMLILQSFPPVSREGVRKRHSERWTGWNVCRWVLFLPEPGYKEYAKISRSRKSHTNCGDPAISQLLNSAQEFPASEKMPSRRKWCWRSWVFPLTSKKSSGKACRAEHCTIRNRLDTHSIASARMRDENQSTPPSRPVADILYCKENNFFCPSPGGSTVFLSVACGPAGNRTATGSLSATQECRDTNCTTTPWGRLCTAKRSKRL